MDTSLSFSNPFWPIAMAILLVLIVGGLAAVLAVVWLFRSRMAQIPGVQVDESQRLVTTVESTAKALVGHAENLATHLAKSDKAKDLVADLLAKVGVSPQESPAKK